MQFFMECIDLQNVKLKFIPVMIFAFLKEKNFLKYLTEFFLNE